MFDAVPEVVFDALTDPDAQKGLYAAAPDWIVRSECDLACSPCRSCLRHGSDGPERGGASPEQDMQPTTVQLLWIADIYSFVLAGSLIPKGARSMNADTHDLTAGRMLDAAVEDVFDAYTNPDAGRTVFAGGPDWVVEVACDLHVGGVWRITSAPPGSAAYREANRFTLIDRPRRLAVKSALTMPDGSNLERDVEVTVKSEDGGKTRMTILQKGFPNAEVRDAFVAAFPGIFDRLERLAQAWPVRGESRS